LERTILLSSGEWRENQILIPDWTYFYCPGTTLLMDSGSTHKRQRLCNAGDEPVIAGGGGGEKGPDTCVSYFLYPLVMSPSLSKTVLLIKESGLARFRFFFVLWTNDK